MHCVDCVPNSVISAASLICFLLARYLSHYLFTANQIALQKKTRKLSSSRDSSSAATYVKQFGSDLEQKRLELTWSAQVD